MSSGGGYRGTDMALGYIQLSIAQLSIAQSTRWGMP